MANIAQGQWSYASAIKFFSLPFSELMYQAQTIHRENFNPKIIQISTLLSIKTGSCPENCSYCPQSAHYQTGLKKEPLMDITEVVAAAKRAKAAGSTRFCMGAAWRGPRDQDLQNVCEMIKEVKKLNLETCVTLGLLQQHQAAMLKDAGLDFYNHNIDTSREHYDKIITTRTFDDRLQTLEHIRSSGIKVCCGGILGMGETNEDRINMLVTLANLTEPPESVPINQLIKIPGTPLEHADDIDNFDFVRTIALARIMIPQAYIRLSAGREQMSEELQSLCFLAGANSIFYGEKLLTAQNPIPAQDNLLLQRLGLEKQVIS
ncbi:Biotin synthase [Candidatus Trichorickettsia mobilis]|uniref:Biotin synthase n=1 Tax=Candidatus Trichorickettsia mobilis TaxID=1346319 RepID=A0ABZ0USX4_9RICK|nr:biotin synthase BioB [Candidatus Trichorickettsia mobilis]WPY00748.1 Biotin synthase [Candidatus Trichorickettsia mobilis]